MCNIILIVVILVALLSCKSHRETVKHEEVRYQRAILDSTATRVDSVERRDSVWLSWMAGEVSLEVDSVDWHFTWDSVGRPSRVAGKRVVSRRSSSAGQKAAATIQEETHEEARQQRAILDSTAALSVQDKHVETNAGWHPDWLELACCGVLLVLAIGGVLHLRKLTERWSQRR